MTYLWKFRWIMFILAVTMLVIRHFWQFDRIQSLLWRIQFLRIIPHMFREESSVAISSELQSPFRIQPSEGTQHSKEVQYVLYIKAESQFTTRPLSRTLPWKEASSMSLLSGLFLFILRLSDQTSPLQLLLLSTSTHLTKTWSRTARSVITDRFSLRSYERN